MCPDTTTHVSSLVAPPHSRVDSQHRVEQLYRQALLMEPTFTDASNNLGNLLRTRGDVEEAVEFFQRAGAHVTSLPVA